MVKLPEGVPGPAPDARPTGPDPRQLGIANVGVAEQAEVFSAQAGVKEIADRLTVAAQRIQNREDAIEHANRIGEYEDFSTSLLRDTILKQDISNRSVLGGVGEELRKKKADIIGRGGISPDGMARLEADLERTRVLHSVKAADLSRVQSSKKVALRMGEYINQLSSEYLSDAGNPAKLLEVFSKLDRRIETLSGAMEPHEEIQYSQTGKSLIVFSALNMLAEKNPDAAENVLMQTPGIDKILTPEHGAGILKTINSARSAKNTGFTLGENQIRFDARGREIARGPKKEEQIKVEKVIDEMGVARWAKIENVVDKQAPAAPQHVRTPEDEYKAKAAEALATSEGRVMEGINKDIETARQVEPELRNIKTALDSGTVATGLGANPRLWLGKLLVLAGADTEETRRFTGAPATAESLNSAANRIGLLTADRMTRVTNMSLEFIKESYPRLTMTEGGIRLITQSLELANARDKEVGKLMDDYQNKYRALRPGGDIPTFFEKRNEIDEKYKKMSNGLEDAIKKELSKPSKSWAERFDENVIPKSISPFPPSFPIPPGHKGLGWKEDENGAKVGYFKNKAGKPYSKILELPSSNNQD